MAARTRNTRLGVRNMAMVLVGVFGLMRVSELVGLKWKDVKWTKEGMMVGFRRKKRLREKQWWPFIAQKGSSVCPVQRLYLWSRWCGEGKGKYMFGGRGESHISQGHV